MAQMIYCDGTDDDPAAYMVTMVENGDVAAFCPADFLGFCLAYITAVAPEMLAPPPKPPPRQRKPRQPKVAEPAEPEPASDTRPD